MHYIFKTDGTYLGFISNGNLFSRDGVYLGWVEGRYVWDSSGQFRGFISEDGNYILRNIYTVPPVPRAPRPTPATPALPAPRANISSTIFPVGFVDAF